MFRAATYRPDADGLPPRSALSPRQRMVVQASEIGDLALRTWVSSVLATTVAPSVVATSLRDPRSGAERSDLAFYAELAAARDPVKSFPAPTELPRVSSRPASQRAERLARGRVDDISFTSSFTAINPAMRNRWSAWKSNNVVHAQHWRHDDGPRPTLCVIHGFMGSSYLVNGRFFTLPWYYRSGYDVLMYTLPFHGRRAEKFSPFSGFGYFAGGLAGFAEAMAQAVHDFRSIVDYLRHTGVDRIALTGISLGGYTSALVASVDDRLEAVIPNCPVVTPKTMFDEWFPANKLVDLGLRLSNISPEELSRRAVLQLPTELPAPGAQGPSDDHHRPGRPDGSTGSGADALGTLGPLRAAVVSGRSRGAREPAGLSAPDDRLSTRPMFN